MSDYLPPGTTPQQLMEWAKRGVDAAKSALKAAKSVPADQAMRFAGDTVTKPEMLTKLGTILTDSKELVKEVAPMVRAADVKWANGIGFTSSVADNFKATGILAREAGSNMVGYVTGKGGAVGGLLGKTGSFAGKFIVTPLRETAKFAASRPGWMIAIAAVGTFIGVKAYQNRRDARTASALQLETAMLQSNTADVRSFQQSQSYGQSAVYPDAHPAFDEAPSKWGKFAESRLADQQAKGNERGAAAYIG